MITLIKTLIAFICNHLGLSYLNYYLINKKHKNNYIKVINYHDTESRFLNNFDNQIKLLKKYYQVISIDEFKKYCEDKEFSFKDKPALLITFDDGKANNFEGSYILDKNNCTGTFFVSSEKIDNNDKEYMKIDDLKDLMKRGHFVSNHTNSHHRFDISDRKDTLNYEIVDSNSKLNKSLSIKNDCFCWCGGEINTYTKEAFDIIKDNYSYVFTTCAGIHTKDDNVLMIHRTNIEAFWNLELTKFQCLGLWDYKYRNMHEYLKKLFNV